MSRVKKRPVGALHMMLIGVGVATCVVLWTARTGIDAGYQVDVGSQEGASGTVAVSHTDPPTMHRPLREGREAVAGSLVEEHPPSKADLDKCQLLATGPAGAPIEGARVSSFGEWEVLGLTDAEGSLEISHDSAEGAVLLVRAPGFAPKMVKVLSPVPVRMDVQLTEAWSLVGRVVDPEGNSVGPGIRVLALHPAENLHSHRVRASMNGGGPILVATTDADSRFTFYELDPSLPYRLFAGGQGFCIADPFGEMIDLTQGASEYVLTIYPVYALRISIREPGGALPRLGEALGGRWWGTPSGLTEGARTVMSGDWTVPLLGIDSAESKPVSRFDRINFFTTRRDQGETIDVLFEADYPGYDAIQVRLEAGRATESAPIPVHVVEVTAQAAGFGSLTVWVDPIDHLESIIPFDPMPVCPTLFLQSLDDSTDSRPRIEVRLSDLGRGFQTVTGIPFGSYKAELQAQHQLFRYPKSKDGPVIVTINSLQSDLRIPLKRLGSLRFEVSNLDGSEYVGAVQGTHVRVLGKEIGSFHFSGPPYSVALLPEGDYTLNLFLGNRVLQESFSIHENQITNLSLQ